VAIGINHATLAVRDLERSFRFYTEVLGLRPVARRDRGACLLLAGDDWIALVSDEETRREPLPEYTHLAFTVAPETFEPLEARVLGAGAARWQENASEGDSLHFLDPDGHKLELRASGLEARLEADGRGPLPGMRFYR